MHVLCFPQTISVVLEENFKAFFFPLEGRRIGLAKLMLVAEERFHSLINYL